MWTSQFQSSFLRFLCVQIPKFIVTQVRLQNAENQRKQNKERAVRKLLKKITTEKSSDKPLQEVRGLKPRVVQCWVSPLGSTAAGSRAGMLSTTLFRGKVTHQLRECTEHAVGKRILSIQWRRSPAIRCFADTVPSSERLRKPSQLDEKHIFSCCHIHASCS